MEFRILGPLEVADNGREIALRRRKQRALLVALLLDAGHPVSADRLIDGLWGEQAPATAREALQNYISQLRKALGADVVATEPAGYVVRVQPDQLDLARFERLMEEARRTESPDERAAKLREALALWRGPALGDLAYEPFAELEGARLEELRLAAQLDLLDAELARGGGAELVGEIETLVAEHPFDERLRAQLMLALYRAGRQADALEAYRQARTVLVDELGIEPGPQLRELEQAMLRQDAALVASAARPLARKTVTVLAARVEGLDGVDAEAARALLDDCVAVLEWHGATVERFAGDSLTAIFGVPVAHEDDALRAVRAAASLCERGVELHIGVATGEVVADERSVTGNAVARAKQLERSAAARETLLDAPTVRLVRDAVRTTRTKESAFCLREVVAGAPAIARRFDARLVGRDADLARLLEAFASAREGRSVRAVVLGDAGIGKTRLANELISRVHGEATVLTGHCVSYGEGATYLPLIEMLDAGELRERLRGDNDAASSAELFWEVRGHFEALARERPLVLVFDDVHWAEPTLVDLIDYVVERVTDVPLLVVCLARPDLLDRRPAWGDGAILLGPLGDTESEALLAALPGGPQLEPAVRARVLETAEGNPLFVEQLLTFVAEDDGGAIPPSIDALLASRIERLPAAERSVLEDAAVVGREFSTAALRELVDEPGMLHERLLALEQRGFVDGETFRHVLIRDVAYSLIPKALRADLHERLGDRLAQRGEPDEVVGYHLEQAYEYCVELDAVDRRARRLAEDAGARLGDAGIRAWKRGDAPATINLLGRATALLPADNPRRGELLCELGGALATAGETARAEEVLIAAASPAAERRIELRAHVELGRLRFTRGAEESADDLLALAMDAVPVFEAARDERSLGRTWRFAGYLQGAVMCRMAVWQSAAEEALIHYRAAGWPAATCLGEIAAALYHGPVPTSDAARRCEQLLANATIGGEATLLCFLGGLRAMQGDIENARLLLRQARALYEDLGQLAPAATNLSMVEAEVERHAGEPAAAARILLANYELLERIGEVAYLPNCAAELADMLYRQGRYAEATTWVERARQGRADDLATEISRRAVAAKLAARAGKTNARAIADEAVKLARETDSLNQRARVWLDFGEVLELCGREQEAAAAVRSAIELYEAKENAIAAAVARSRLRELVPA
jgi:DNA-binding SARP family transcriptional activator